MQKRKTMLVLILNGLRDSVWENFVGVEWVSLKHLELKILMNGLA